MLCSWIRNINKIQKTTHIVTNKHVIVDQLRHLRALRKAPSEFSVLDATAEPPQDVGLKRNERRDEIALDFGKREAHVPTFNLAAHVNNSKTLQQLMSLGVDLHSIERRKGLGQFVLRLDFEQNVKPYLTFLSDQGISPHDFGVLITKNPLLFKVELDDLQTRVEYLRSKRFSDEARRRIFTQNPYWLMFSTRRVDRRLGYFQKEFGLSGHDLRLLATKEPRLITYNMEHLRKSVFTLREEMGFSYKELQSLIVHKPRLMMIPPDDLVERFSYAHNEMGLSHAQILQCPELLASREFRLRERHEFLKLLGRAQYDPQKDLYVSPSEIVQGNNFYFVRNVAKSDLQTFDLFLKTR
ncbi:transcription termination factor 3, mitochondrial [Drosophila grimshawi]|uniref:Transcription termination factor 3, mitochondrial n=1 Tax=Drosophila grimshawi TaxID=7222 RepID=B4IYY6_DROGR|nr:transcription termination factor 3, mitochondrial [Drosophila grimshawi]EDV97694.1 GH17011 [Drosophila grimshawi]